MRSTLSRMMTAALILGCMAPWAAGVTVTFDTADIIDAIGGLHNGTNQWGLWAVRVQPVVTGGSFAITGASTTQTGWGTNAPSYYAWNTYGTNCAWFYDESGAEAAGTASNPLYMIMDVPADTFWSSSFNGSGAWVGDWSPGGGGTFYSSGYDGGAGGTNVITAVDAGSTFSLTFGLDPGATWNGEIQFLVDGSKYTLGTYGSPGVWQQDFFGDYGTGGGLPGNMGTGNTALPEPVTMGSVALAVAGLGWYTRRRLAAR